MQAEKMRNMIVLKNLPSNIVDEAIIILKNNKKTKVLNKIDKQEETKQSKTDNDNYIIKEAEMLINSYTSKYENEKQVKSYSVKRIEKRCKRLKIIAIGLGILTTLLIIF